MSGISAEEYNRKKEARTFYKFQFRGLGIEELVKLNPTELAQLLHARARRRMSRGMDKKYTILAKKIDREKKKAEGKIGEKPAVVKTHLRNALVFPSMIGGVVGIYNGKQFNAVEIKGEMTGRYLAEFALSYKPVTHGRPGIGATHSSRFIPLK